MRAHNERGLGEAVALEDPAAELPLERLDDLGGSGAAPEPHSRIDEVSKRSASG